jgi:hypothetical protein
MMRVLNPMRAITPKDLNKFVDKRISFAQVLRSEVALVNAGAGASASGHGAGASASGHCAGAFEVHTSPGSTEAQEATDGSEDKFFNAKGKSKSGEKNARQRRNRQRTLAANRIAVSEETRLIDQAVNQTNATLKLQLLAADEKIEWQGIALRTLKCQSQSEDEPKYGAIAARLDITNGKLKCMKIAAHKLNV